MMHTKISNEIAITNPSEDIKKYCQEKLTLDNPDYINAQRMGRYTGNIEPKIELFYVNGNIWYLPFGTLRDIWTFIDKNNYDIQFSPFKPLSMQGSINLYPYQEKALKGLLNAKGGVLQAPCGSGKTQIGLQLIKELGGKALWLTHTKELLKQSKLRCEAYFTGDFGTITEGKVHIGNDITFATVQTLSKINPEIYKDAFNTIIVDECHHCVGTPTKIMSFYKVLSNSNARYKYGLSATLSRSDNLINCVFSILGNICYTITKQEVADKIIKAKYEPIMIGLAYDKKLYCDTDGTIIYNKLLDTLSDNDMRNDIIINHIQALKGKGKQLVLVHRVKHAEYLAYAVGGIAITSKVKKRNFTDADIIISTYALAKEGLDIPDLQFLHLTTPQKNPSVTEQAVGRIERNYEGKEQPTCFDYVDENISYCMTCFYKRRKILGQKKGKYYV